MSFVDLNGACRALLFSCVHILNTSGLRYVVAGGWVPLLLEPKHPSLVHPGTRDVDVLMIDDLQAVQSAAEALLLNRFRPSAKHEFQMLRDARVGSRDFVFNIDLMHPYEASDTPVMFNDIFDLGVNDAYDSRGSRYAKSIAFRSAEIVYQENLFDVLSIEGVDLDERECSLDIPLLSASAFLLSKCESASVPKRTRDAFDIYYLLSGSQGEYHGANLHALATRFPQVDKQVEVLRKFLRDEPSRFNQNVTQHARQCIADAAAHTLSAIT